MRAANKTRKMIRHEEDAVAIEHGREWKGKDISSDKHTAWTEEANVMLRE